MEPTTLVVCLLWCVFNCYGRGGGAEERGSYGVVGVPLFNGVMYRLCGLRREEVEGIVV